MSAAFFNLADADTETAFGIRSLFRNSEVAKYAGVPTQR